MLEIPRRGSRRGAGNHTHTAHKSPLAKIYYRFHPDFGKEVTIIRRFHIMAGNNVQIRLPDGTQLAVPDWMLDEQACQDVRECDRPCITIPALTHLRRLLSAQPLLRRVRGTVVEGTLLPHAQIQTAMASSVSTGTTNTKPIAGVADAMYRTSEPDAPGGSAKKISNKRGGTQ
jgi:hypothetical protein